MTFAVSASQGVGNSAGGRLVTPVNTGEWASHVLRKSSVLLCKKVGSVVVGHSLGLAMMSYILAALCIAYFLLGVRWK